MTRHSAQELACSSYLPWNPETTDPRQQKCQSPENSGASIPIFCGILVSLVLNIRFFLGHWVIGGFFLVTSRKHQESHFRDLTKAELWKARLGRLLWCRVSLGGNLMNQPALQSSACFLLTFFFHHSVYLFYLGSFFCLKNRLIVTASKTSFVSWISRLDQLRNSRWSNDCRWLPSRFPHLYCRWSYESQWISKKTGATRRFPFFCGPFWHQSDLPAATSLPRTSRRSSPSAKCTRSRWRGAPSARRWIWGGGRCAKVEVWSWKNGRGLRWGKPPEMRVMIY